MRLLRYLNEVFMDAGRSNYTGSKMIYEIYKNPTPKEINELKKAESREKGFRVIADLDNKDVYVSNNNLIHNDMFKILKNILKTDGDEYVFEGSDRLVTFSTTTDNMKGDIESDTLGFWVENHSSFVTRNIKILSRKNFEWMSQWFNVKLVKDLVDKVVFATEMS